MTTEDLSWDRLDALVDTDPIRLRDIAFATARQLDEEKTNLAAVRAWLASYPPIPEDVAGDPEAMIVVRLRKMLGEAR